MRLHILFYFCFKFRLNYFITAIHATHVSTAISYKPDVLQLKSMRTDVFFVCKLPALAAG